MKELYPNMKTDRNLFTSIPVWIRLPNLCFRLWDPKAVSALVSVIGNSIKLDEATLNRARISFARVLVISKLSMASLIS